MKKYGARWRERSNKKRLKYSMWLHWFLLYPMQQAAWRMSASGNVENIWRVESCVVKTDICLLWGNVLTKERIFVLKTCYATHSYRRVKETFHTEFPNSATTLSNSLILWLARKFEEVGSILRPPIPDCKNWNEIVTKCKWQNCSFIFHLWKKNQPIREENKNATFLS